MPENNINTGLRKCDNTCINPATEEKQDSIIAKLSTPDNGYSVVKSLQEKKITDGDHYTCQDYDNDIDVSTPKYWHIKAPNTATRINLLFCARFKESGLIEMFEAPTLSADGTALTSYNNDRNSANTTELLIYRDPTVSADGSNRILVNKIGTGKSTGGIESRDNHFILKQNTSYIIKITTDSNDNQVSNCFEFWES